MRDSSNACIFPISCFSHHPSGSGTSAPTLESVVPEGEGSDEKAEVEVEDRAGDGGESRIVLKSCLKNPVGSGSDGGRKDRVSWRDVEGEELAEVREFDNEMRRFRRNDDSLLTCECVIQ